MRIPKYWPNLRLVDFLGMIVFFVCVMGGTALGQSNNSTDPSSFNAQQFRPWGDPAGLFQTQSAQSLGQWGYQVGLYLNYAHKTLVLRRSKDVELAAPLEHGIGADLMFGLGFTDWLDLYVVLPLTIYQIGEFPNNSALFPTISGQSMNGFFLGDLRFGLKFRLLDERKHGVSLGIKGFISVPTAQLGGRFKKFNGANPVTAGGMITLSREISIVSINFNVGYRFNPRTQLLNLVVSHELFYGLGLGLEVVPRRFALIAEVTGATAISEAISLRSAPLDILLGMRIYATKSRSFAINLGAGLPFTTGYGSPMVRVFFGLHYSPRGRDTDGDGLYDYEDRCPKTPGPRENQGCPFKDRDKDGVLDKDDRCPDTPGPKANQGCPWPDADSDGVLDKDDRCPKKPGPRANQGCPIEAPKDTDKDGILDKNDRCPRRPGPRANRGCPWPDTDRDGLTDNLDKCPRTPGPKDNKGCPLAIKRGGRILILRKIFFDSGKSRIKTISYPVLNAVYNVLIKYPRVNIRIEGHTDDVGSYRYNRGLSRRRAKAVMRYLVNKGIASRRLSFIGYGEQNPLIRSKTPEARAKNRRVEFIIISQ